MDIYLYQMVKFMYRFKRGLHPSFRDMFRLCLLLEARYIPIIQEIPAFFTYLIVDESSQFGFNWVLSFSTR